MSNVLMRWDDVLKLRSGEKVVPKFVDLHPSYSCNCNCEGCAYAGRLDGSSMSMTKLIEAIDILCAAGTQAFDFAGGGEPTVMPRLDTILRHVTVKNAAYGLITNGISMTDDLKSALLDGGTYVRFSLEASNQESFEKYKKVSHHMMSKIFRNISELVIEKRRGKSKLEISLKFSVGKSLRGRKHYENAIRLALDLGVDRCDIKALRHDPEELSVKERIDEHGTLLDVLRGINPIIPVNVWIVPFPEKAIPQCWLNPLHTVVDYKGDVYLCCYYYYRPEKHWIGNLFDHDRPFKKFWMGPEHMEKIKGIDKAECSKVDCKFFRHHLDVGKALTNGAAYFL